MSQASNHVDWCLKKAEKEIEECKKAGLSPKHRGLIKGKVDIGLAKEYIEKAERYLQITEYLKKGGFQDNCISNIFYAMYHCFLSIAAKFGYDSGNQTCTIALIGHLKQEGKINIDARFTEVFKYAEDDSIFMSLKFFDNHRFHRFELFDIPFFLSYDCYIAAMCSARHMFYQQDFFTPFF